jgi:hypothetical protein
MKYLFKKILGSVDNSALFLRNKVVGLARSLDHANKSQDVGQRKMRCKNALVMVIVLSWSFSLWATPIHEINEEKNYFQFTIQNHHTTRQSGQVVNIYVRYAYKKGLPESEYFDYRIMRTKILKYMEPSDELPAGIFWEIIATKMGKELMHEFHLDGISIQLVVLDNPSPDANEPGDHGPTFTLGNIAPLNN